MRFAEVLRRCKGATVIVNNGEERTLVEIEDDFLVLQGGNPQMRITEFVPVSAILRVIRADFSTGHSSFSLELTVSGGDQNRNAGL